MAAGPVIPPPGCTTSTPHLKPLTNVSLHTAFVGGTPFAVQESPDGKFTFVTVGDGLAVLQNNGSGSAPSYHPHDRRSRARTRAWPSPRMASTCWRPANDDAIVISVQQAEQGAANPVAGVLDAHVANAGAVGVAASPDGKFVFLTLQNTTHMAVFNLAKALSSGFNPGDFVGFVPLGVQPVGIGTSPDGKWLYVDQLPEGPGLVARPGHAQRGQPAGRGDQAGHVGEGRGGRRVQPGPGDQRQEHRLGDRARQQHPARASRPPG